MGSGIVARSSHRARIVAVVLSASLVLGLGACTRVDSREPEGELDVDLEYVGDAVRIAVDPSLPLAVVVPGLGRIVGPSGAFSSPGHMVVRGVAAESPEDAVVTTEGPGVDVTFEGTELVSDLTVFFDDPSIGSIVPGDALPLVLHRPDGQPWEARALEFTPDGVPYLVTRDFSPNVLSWIQPPRWLTDSIDNAVNWWAGGTQSRGCDGSGPSWAWVQPTSQMVHLCTISNVDRSSGEVRAELQVQSNR